MILLGEYYCITEAAVSIHEITIKNLVAQRVSPETQTYIQFFIQCRVGSDPQPASPPLVYIPVQLPMIHFQFLRVNRFFQKLQTVNTIAKIISSRINFTNIFYNLFSKQNYHMYVRAGITALTSCGKYLYSILSQAYFS